MDLSKAHLTPASQAEGWITKIQKCIDFLDKLDHLENIPQQHFFHTIYFFNHSLSV